MTRDEPVTEALAHKDWCAKSRNPVEATAPVLCNCPAQIEAFRVAAASRDEGLREALAEALLANIPALNRWLTVGWKESMRDEATPLATKLLEAARRALATGEPT